jgi:TfoX/Sxy family transcriptional regulator of competence genes
MAYNEELAERVRLTLPPSSHIDEVKMMGGLVFMVENKMCVGVNKDHLMVRLDPALAATVLAKAGCRAMEMQGRTMGGFFFVDAQVLDTDEALDYWVNLALAYNTLIPAPKKRSHR